MADGDVVRTVFQTEWLGGNVLGRMIRQYGMADKALQGLGKSQAMSGVAAARNAQQLSACADMQKQMGAAVFDGRISLVNDFPKVFLREVNSPLHQEIYGADN